MVFATLCCRIFECRGKVLLTFCCVYSEVVCLCPGDGGVETAEEAVEPAEPDINELCTDMFEKMAIFLQGELTGVSILPILHFTQCEEKQLHCLSTTCHAF